MNLTASNSLNFGSLVASDVGESSGVIRVDRDLIESALESFQAEVGEIRDRLQRLFDTLEDLLPQVVAAMVEKELTMRSRSVIFHVLQQLSEPETIRVFDVFASNNRVRRHSRLADRSVALWLSEDLPFLLEEGRELLKDYFDELLACAQGIEAARSKVFRTLSIPSCEEHRDLAWIGDMKIVNSGIPLFAWQIPAALRYFLKISWLRMFALQRAERLVSEQVASYCDRLIMIVRRATRDWLSETRWQLNQDLAERTDIWALSAEIVKRLRQAWRIDSLPSKVASLSTGAAAATGD